MYIPENFKITDNKIALEFIDQYNFGLLLCNGEEIPVATHVPFYTEEENGKTVLITHLAKANPHWLVIQKNKHCLVVFAGPNGYVSPSLYSDARNVPTWNYMAVHVKVTAEIIHDTAKKKAYMHQTILKAEKDFEKQYRQLPAAYLEAMYDAIVFLKFDISGIETKFKLSQNKPEEDREKVARFFETNDKKELAGWMKKINKL